MLKKIFLLIVLTAALTAVLPAVDFSMSAGGGGLLGYTFTRYTLEGGNVSSVQNMDRLDYGGFLFFDATYAEFSVLIQGGNNIYQEDMSYSSVPLPGGGTGTGSELYFGFSLIGKYPFTINEKISWFPMLGITYQIALIQRRRPDDGGGVEYDRSKGQSFADMDKYNNPYPLSAWNFFMINVGAGLDYHLTKALFARGEFLFGFRLPTDYELGALEKVKSQMGVNDLQMAGLTGGPTLKFGIGYRFK